MNSTLPPQQATGNVEHYMEDWENRVPQVECYNFLMLSLFTIFTFCKSSFFSAISVMITNREKLMEEMLSN